MGFSKSSPKGKVHSNASLPHETGEIQINKLTLHLKQLEKEEVKQPRVSRRKEIIISIKKTICRNKCKRD